ncbi:MAG TPA: sugar ABC transporter permease [Anaerolineales bacterium]|nr:sugar ABC transporter permease [Anaerolineales bacterium]
MVGWSGRRKALMILLFTAPTIIGIFIFNVYPLILNTYISFTNRNRFRPNPDCEAGLNGILVPNCWSVFGGGEVQTGLGEPYGLADPLFKNYMTVFGDLFTVPALVALLTIAVAVVPLFVAAQVDSRMNRQLTRSVPSWVVWTAGLLGVVIVAWAVNITAAFQELLKTGDFMLVVGRTILFVLIRVPLSFLIGLILALIVSSPGLPGRTFWRIVLFIPWAASSVAILMALVWQFIFRDQGVINQVLLALFDYSGPVWLQNPIYAFGIVVLVDVWFSYPFFMIALLGALAAIPTELYEASEVDGATFMQQLRTITLPLIRPAVLPAAVLTSITAFQIFGTVWALTLGGPTGGAGQTGATEFVMVYAYRQIFQTQNYGLATAFAVIIFLALFIATLYSLRITRITKGAYE